jgi:homocysteine S-methyltransferase
MAKYRDARPQLDDDIFPTDGGLETTLIFHEALEFPELAAFVLMEDDEGRERLRSYFRRYIAVAHDAGTGFVAEAPTWRANPDWAAKLGYDADGLARVNRHIAAISAACVGTG